jgi:phosphatidylserine/phosphatidylglycerophosphate/cardiolipin synthase-like enzyme
VAIRSKPLATFFANLLRSDMKLELDAEAVEALSQRVKRKRSPDLVEAVPEDLPVQLFPSKTLNPPGKIKVRPVLTPDSYMDIIPGLLESATKSIEMEQQYIRSNQDQIIKLLMAIKIAKEKNPGLEVRIILGKIFSASDFKKEEENIANLKANFGLVLDNNIRYIDTSRFVHCHNKMIIVDGTEVLISSQNWSNTGVGSNREGGVLMHYPDLAQYYSEIFESDWSTALTNIPKPEPSAIEPEALTSGGFVKVVAADYQEV